MQLVFAAVLIATGAQTATPTGYFDAADAVHFAGWAKDPDLDGPIVVHIYVDGQIVKAVVANQFRADVGFHAFDWVHPSYGAGKHSVIAYAIGADATGAPDGENPGLAPSPKTIDGSCQGLAESDLVWCTDMPSYWTTRQADTEMVGNDSVRVGVNKSYGGTILQLYGKGWDKNLTVEHGGGAIQLSVWGYDCPSDGGWFDAVAGTCNATPFASEQACHDAGYGACNVFGCASGAHVSDCVTSKPCGTWSAGAPWNPIQAQGADCGWGDAGNDVATAGWEGATYHTVHDGPYHFTKSEAPVQGMTMEQWVTPHEGYAEVKYRLTYSGPYTWSTHPQEIPAIFTSLGISAHYYFYGGAAPFTGGAVQQIDGPVNSFLHFPARPAYGHGADMLGTVREGWWSVCDADGGRCLTVAAFDDVMNEAALSSVGAGEGYITALGYFGVVPGMDLSWTVYLFPYRYDAVVGGQSVRDVIAGLAPPSFKALCSCAGKACGPDGCGGSCGDCGSGATCEVNTCVTVPSPDTGGSQVGEDTAQPPPPEEDVAQPPPVEDMAQPPPVEDTVQPPPEEDAGAPPPAPGEDAGASPSPDVVAPEPDAVAPLEVLTPAEVHEIEDAPSQVPTDLSAVAVGDAPTTKKGVSPPVPASNGGCSSAQAPHTPVWLVLLLLLAVARRPFGSTRR